MTIAPGTYVNISTAPPSPNNNTSVGTWFVTGETAQGPTGVAIPITSMTDYANYLGARVSYGFLYDALNEFFQDGGVLAYVSRVTGPAAAAAAVTLVDCAGSPQNTLSVTANGSGAYGNNIQVVISAGTASNSFVVAIVNNGVTVATSPNCFVPQDAVNWQQSLNPWVVLVTIANLGSPTATPNNNPATGTFSLTSGSDNTTGVTETQWTNALTAFALPSNSPGLGPGNVSAPGHTTAAGYLALAQHAQSYNRFALLDVADNSSASALVSQATTFQSSAGAALSGYAAIFAPWVVIPGIYSTNPGSASAVPLRTIPPSAMAAALMAANYSRGNYANVPAAGQNGISSYAVNLTQAYVSADRATLNAAGICDIRNLSTGIQLYGYVTLSTDPNWFFLNNALFRMQMVYDFHQIAENFVFDQIDGRGQLFAKLNGALAGKCQQYWAAGALYGATAALAFSINTGSQVNTPTTISAGQLNAQANVIMSPFAQVVTINVTKYLVTQGVPPASP